MIDKFEPQEVPIKTIENVIDRYQAERDMGSDALQGMYYALDVVHSGHWIACDNSGGECCVEEFSSKEGAIAYLEGYELEDSYKWTENGYELLSEEELEAIFEDDELER